MTWLWVFVVVLGTTFGDLWTAKGMYQMGEVDASHATAARRMLHYIFTRRLVLGGIAANAMSYGALLALLSLAPLSFAVPVTALSYVVKTIVARWYLGEHVTAMRWVGVLFVTCGIICVAV